MDFPDAASLLVRENTVEKRTCVALRSRHAHHTLPSDVTMKKPAFVRGAALDITGSSIP
jgi:hypothetical protein